MGKSIADTMTGNISEDDRSATRRISLRMYMTIDGHAEFPKYPGSDDPPSYPDPNFSDMWSKHYESIDTIILGRRAYDDWAAFWPPSKRTDKDPKDYVDFSKFVSSCKKVVFSNSLTEPKWEKSRVMAGNIEEAVAQLRSEPGKDMALGGGPLLAQAFMRLDLIDDYYFTVSPVIYGQGKPMFGSLVNQISLKLVSSHTYKSGELFVHYQRVK